MIKVAEKTVPMASLISGYTKKHFTELGTSGVCTCICPDCHRPAIDHIVTTYKDDVATCEIKG